MNIQTPPTTRAAKVELMRSRYANHRDLWTGRPLKKSEWKEPKPSPATRQLYLTRDDPHWHIDQSRIAYEEKAVEAFYLMAFRTAYNRLYATERDHVLRFCKAIICSARRLPDPRDAILWYFLEGEALEKEENQ